MKRDLHFAVAGVGVGALCFFAALLAALAGSSCSAAPRTETIAATKEALSCSDVSVLTAHNNNQRTGVQPCETTLTPATALELGQRAENLLDDQGATAHALFLSANLVGGQVRDVVIVATLRGFVYVFDAKTLAPVFAPTLTSTTNVTGAGITSTPVIDKTNDVLYLVEQDASGFWLMVYDINSAGHNTMTQLAKILIGGTCKGSQPPETFLPTGHRQMPALLFDHGYVYVAFGANPSVTGENSLYNGWVFAYLPTIQQTSPPTASLSLAGSPYCVSRTMPANADGRGGIWQATAGLSADANGNVYAATGNGEVNASNDPFNDGNSYVQLPKGLALGSNGAPLAKYTDPYYFFLQANDLDISSTGLVILPGPGLGRILGAGKHGRFTLLDQTLFGLATLRAAFNQYGPILGGNLNSPNLESFPGVVVPCNSTSPKYCDGLGQAVWNGTANCCPDGCETQNKGCVSVHGSNPHIHGQPSYFNGNVYYWPEKDYPRYLGYDPTQGVFTGTPTPTAGRVSADPGDKGPPIVNGNQFSGMPGGMGQLSSNGNANTILWALVPDASDNPHTSPQTYYHLLLTAFDVSNPAKLPMPHLLQLDAGQAGAHMPLVANGMVYVTQINPPNPGLAKIIAYGIQPDCQRISDAFGVDAGVGFGFAPPEIRNPPPGWWQNNNCNTHPQTPSDVQSLCQKASEIWGVWANHTWGYSPAEFQTAQGWWVTHGCNTQPVVSDMDLCQRAADTYGIVAGITFGSAPQYVQDWWNAKPCNRSARRLDLCQKAADLYGFTGSNSSGFAPADVQTWWQQESCNATTYTSTAQLCQNAANLFAIEPGVSFNGATDTGTQNWWRANCGSPNTPAGPQCQGISELFGAKPGGGSNIAAAPSYVQTWWNKQNGNIGCTTKPLFFGDSCQVVSNTFGLARVDATVGVRTGFAGSEANTSWFVNNCQSPAGSTQGYHPRNDLIRQYL
jgi:hypothetical protein